MFLAFSRSATTVNVSPASGMPSRPRISTGVAGSASSTALLRSSNIARTLPKVLPKMNVSPMRNVPFWISTVATAPRPRSSLASSTAPVAGRSGEALSSCRSATRQIISIRRFKLVFCLAETSTKTYLPPHSSGTYPRSASCFFTRSGSAPGLSILFTAKINGTFAAVAWSIASSVCGITPSSAATTMTTISVTLAPRARMRVNAS